MVPVHGAARFVDDLSVVNTICCRYGCLVTAASARWSARLSVMRDDSVCGGVSAYDGAYVSDDGRR